MSNHLLLTGLILSAASFSALAAVPDGWSVEPADGSSVEEIKTFVVTNPIGGFDPYVNRKVVINGVDYAIDQKVTGTKDDTNTITMRESITEEGTYNVVIPKGTFDYNYNYWMDEGEQNPEISFTLTIGGGDKPGPEPGEFTPIDNPDFTISPAQGVVGQIKSLTVEYLRSGLFPEGYVSNRPTLVNETNGETVATFTVNEGGGMRDVILSLDNPFTVPGQYLVRIPAGSISDYMDEEWPAADFRYVIDGSIEPIAPQETVFATPADKSSVRTLSRVLLEFPDMTEIFASGPNKDKVTVKHNDELTDVKVSFEYDHTTMYDSEIAMVFTPALTEAGEYEIYVPESTLSLGASTFDTRYNNEFTLQYNVEGAIADGTKITVEPLTYKVISGADHTLSVTWPEDESMYSGVKEIPSTVVFEDEEYTVVEVGNLAFSEVKGISDMTLPETVTAIGEGAFWESSLSSIALPSGLLSIGDSAFENCSLTSITVPESVTSLGADVFSLCSSLETINLNSTLTAIPGNMASGCTKLEAIEIPESVTSIGEFAFSECTALADVTLPSKLTTIDRFAFAYTQALTSLPIPETVTTLGHGVFYQSAISEASLPASITVIPDGMYQCCTNLESFEIGGNVTEIEQEAFYWCFGLKSITFGESVAKIGKDAFKGDDALTKVVSLNTVPPTGAAFTETVYANAILTVPGSAVEAYRKADGWKEFSKISSAEVGVKAVSCTGFSVKAVEGGIEVASEGNVDVFDTTGRNVYNGASGFIPLASGLYIVTSGEASQKVAVK